MQANILYNTRATYEANCLDGPLLPDNIPDQEYPEPEEWFDLVGVRVRSRGGVPAGPLLGSGWTGPAFKKLGVHIGTYKTISAEVRPVNGFPNVCYLEVEEMFDPNNPPKVLYTRETPPADRSKLAITNSFGMPSKDAEFLRKDIPKAIAQAKEGQVLIVSVVGTNEEGFVKSALFAKECGAKIIEANFSCPNVCSKEGQLYLDPEAVAKVSRAIVDALQGTPLIIKVGRFESKEQLAKTFIAAANAGVRAVNGINTVPVEILTKDGLPALGANRRVSGVCGFPIRETALTFARQAREVIKENKLNLTLIAGGGITQPEHFNEFLKYADFVMCATGFYGDYEIFNKWHESTAPHMKGLLTAKL